jgi:membrane-associated protease RseP (regulator of RpoE activity)
MTAASRRPARYQRPGLTLIELLAAIALTGTVFTLLLPRLVPAPEPASQSPVCPYGAERGMMALYGPEVAERGFIGVQLGPVPTGDGYIWVRQPLPGRPAQNAGILPGDVIVRVDGLSTRGRSVEEVVQLITRGRAGTPVRLTVRRLGSADTRELKIRRASFLSVFLPGFSRYWDPRSESEPFVIKAN